MDLEREQKQIYLRDEIINGGYDSNDFEDFVDELKGEEGLNIDAWSFQELKQVIINYPSINNQRL